MNIRYFSLPLFLCAVFGNAGDTSVIPNASYVIQGEPTSGGVPGTSSKWCYGGRSIQNPSVFTFFTFNGTPIQRIESSPDSLRIIKQKLDPAAPKPQPATYRIPHYKGDLLRSEADYIIFHDKNGNEISSYRYDKKSQEINVVTSYSEPFTTKKFKRAEILQNPTTFPLDLSVVRFVPEPIIVSSPNIFFTPTRMILGSLALIAGGWVLYKRIPCRQLQKFAYSIPA